MIKKINGTVKKGQSRGKELGFPTINISLTESVEEGIYVSHILIDNKKYNALTFIGPAKTFDQTEIFAETYVFDFSRDVYGQSVSVMLLKKIRDNQKFDSAEELVKQMEEDKKLAEEYFKISNF